ncbi:MAG: type II toxin-antitoxin system VapC family toxin [Thaumarchaeota archaeon]|nr:type II toxin-antitoxin system VapC family toxin [Nitrososphaerota archaeon]MCL5319044.1 type II toxin-antitoxin system VapC family toxin [Nitrososphaerota archaeon]
MRRSSPTTKTFLLDNNVFISAVKSPRKSTETLRLILRLIEDSQVKLVGNDLLVEEMLRYMELLKSETATTILAAPLNKIEIIIVQEKYRKICKAYVKTLDKADILHAATCLQADAAIITNDHHFDNIRDEGIITVWSIAEAINNI